MSETRTPPAAGVTHLREHGSAGVAVAVGGMHVEHGVVEVGVGIGPAATTGEGGRDEEKNKQARESKRKKNERMKG